jgi:hypothetical protein
MNTCYLCAAPNADKPLALKACEILGKTCFGVEINREKFEAISL